MNASSLKSGSVDKIELLAMVLDIIEAAERSAARHEFEHEFVQAVELTADALHRFADAKRNLLDGLPADYPTDILERHTRLLKLRKRSQRSFV